jgi:hypothetical protein
MKTFTYVWKKLLIGMIAVFLSMVLIPVTGSLPIEREQAMMTKSHSDGIILYGTMGQNNWYISPVTITFVTDNRTFVQIDGGEWSEYIVPLVVDTEGLHEVWWYYIDEYGNQSPTYSTSFKIDMTPPSVTIIIHRIGLFKIGVTIVASDNMSGIVLVEFYLDDALVGSITTPPYEYVLDVGFGGHSVKVIVYDAAGLSGSNLVIIPYNQMSEQQIPPSDTPILPPIDRTYFVGQIHNLTIDGNDYHFESTNIRKFGFWRHNIRSWGFSYDHYMGHYSCGWGGAEFHGILKPDFIWGYFTVLQHGQAESN